MGIVLYDSRLDISYRGDLLRFAGSCSLICMPMPKTIRVMTVEDHPIFRGGLEILIASQSDMELVAQAENAEQAIAEYRRLRPDVVLMDHRLPGTSDAHNL